VLNHQSIAKSYKGIEEDDKNGLGSVSSMRQGFVCCQKGQEWNQKHLENTARRENRNSTR
jgi:hypothetical protein